jgi:hypothetical protein
MSKHNSSTIRWLLLSILLCALGALWFSRNAAAQAPTEPPPLVRQLARDKDFETQPATPPYTPALPAGTSTIDSKADFEIIEGYPTSWCSDKALMHIGYDDYMNPDGKITRGLLKFSLTTIPAGAVINNVQLQVYLVGSWDFPGYSRTITTYRIAAAWLEEIATWNNAPALGEAYGSAAVTESNWGWYSFNVTALVNGWRSGAFSNYGIALRGPEHSGNDSSWRAFATGATIYPPHLVVNYTLAGVTESRAIAVFDPANTAVSDTAAADGDFILTATPGSQTVFQGAPVAYTLSVSPTGGFSDTVTLTVGGLPASTSFGWSANPIVSPDGTQVVSSMLNVSTTASTPAGSYPLVVTGTSGDLVHAVPVTLTVRSFSVYLPVILRQKQPVPYNTLFLLIGIADYEHMDPRPGSGARAGSPGYNLDWSVRDSKDVDSILFTYGFPTVVNQFTAEAQAMGFPSSNFLVLNDAQATKAAIRNAIVGWLNDRAIANTTVVIFFSGHGSSDGVHEYIAPYDLDCNPCGATPETTSWDLTTAIRDDELAGWLNQLESQREVLILDSCFSGGMATAANDLARGLEAHPNDQRASQAGGQLLARVAASGRLVLMASAANQGSWESDALENGVFTYYLVQALLASNADTNLNGRVSVEEAFAYLAAPVDSYVLAHTGEHQNPQISDGISGEVDLTVPQTALATCPAW